MPAELEAAVAGIDMKLYERSEADEREAIGRWSLSTDGLPGASRSATRDPEGP
jgi:hypothetical protein